jgi:serine/threonine protein phosphatase PrpC
LTNEVAQPSNIDYNTYNPRGPVSVIPAIYRRVVGLNEFIMLASDGLFDAFISQEAVNFNILATCQNIVDDACRRTTDDITVIISRLS